MRKTLQLLSLLCAAATPLSASAIVIDTTPFENSSIGSFGETNTATYGQTFTVGSDTVLDSFTFFLDDHLNSDVIDFQAYVYAWNGSRAAGPSVYSGTAMSTTNNGGAGGFEEITISTGGVALTSGAQYVAFFSASNLFDGVVGTSTWASVAQSSVYDGGGFVFLNNAGNFGLLTTANWASNYQCLGCDLSFRMVLSEAKAVPEPGVLSLLAVALVGFGLIRRPRRP